MLSSTVSRDISVIPHTETSASAERKFTVSFLKEQEIVLEDINQSVGYYDLPIYQFQDEPSQSSHTRIRHLLTRRRDFLLFQEAIYGMRPVLLRTIDRITSNRELESCGQDLRLWSSDDDKENVTLMFYTNSRSAYPPKLYYTEQGKRHL